MLLWFHLFWHGLFNSAMPLVPRDPTCAGLCCSGTSLAGVHPCSILFAGWQHPHVVVPVTPVLTHSHIPKAWQRPHKTGSNRKLLPSAAFIPTGKVTAMLCIISCFPGGCCVWRSTNQFWSGLPHVHRWHMNDARITLPVSQSNWF